MAQSVNSWLNALNQHWTPEPSDFAGARSHRDSIETRLKNDLGCYGIWEIGSLGHGTAVWLYSDVDYIASMPGSRPTNQWTTLNKVKAALQARFHTTLIEVRQPAVVCHFSDGDVEVVPCFSAGDGGYWIPDPVGTWMKTYPNVHNDYVTAVNKKHGGGAKALARQLKIWKYKLNVPVSSCYLEMRAAKHLDGESVYAPLTDLAMMLSKLQEKKLRAMNDPTGSGARFTAYSSDAKGAAALSKLGTAVSRVQKAHGYYVDDDDAGAITQLRLLFDHSY